MLEIIAQSVEDAKIIEAAGGGRIELVSGISVGGLTPSYGMIEAVVKAVKIPVNVMVRPHAYHFDYKPEDLSVMKKDIEIIRSLGASGIVTGVLSKGAIDFDSFNDLVGDFNTTFHRALDETADIKAMYKAVSGRVSQVLTSGGPGKAEDNLSVLDGLYAINAEKLLIGSGVTLNNLAILLERYPKANFHVGSDARVNQTFSNRIDEKHIKLMIKLLENGNK